jgi:DNA polymerase-3 subunit gamma/tau
LIPAGIKAGGGALPRVATPNLHESSRAPVAEIQSSAPAPFSPFESDSTRKQPVVRMSSAAAIAPEIKTVIASSAIAEAEPEAPVEVNEQTPVSIDAIRDAITAALDKAGHQTAATLLSRGAWTLSGDVLQAAVPSKKKMLELTINGETDKITKAALRSLGVGYKLSVIPGDVDAVTEAPKQRPVSTGDAANALDNPLVKQAQEIFKAEVRGILDLSDKR